MLSEQVGSISESEEAWFALQVTPRHEYKVANYLNYRGCDNFVPTYKVKRQWSDRTKIVECPLFPTYVFCRMSLSKSWITRSVPGVNRIVGMGPTPCSIPDPEIESIRTLLKSGVGIMPTSYLRVGEKVQIREGPLVGLRGIIVRSANRQWLVVSVDLIGRSVMAHIPESAVEALIA